MIYIVSDIYYIMIDIRTLLAEARMRAQLSQRELASRARTSQPAIARLESGGADPRFSTLERLIAAAGFGIRVELVPSAEADALIETYKRDVDRSLLRENLGRSVDARLRSLDASTASVDELRQARRGRPGRARRPPSK